VFVNYPLNHSPALRTTESYCATPEEFAEVFRAEWGKEKITDTPASIEYLVKISLSEDTDYHKA